MSLIEEIAFRQSLFWGGVLVTLGTGGLYAVFACYRPPSWWKTLLKTLPVATLIAGAYANFAAPLLIAALALSLVGDIALSRSGDRAFLVGLIGFAAAHLAYLVHFFELAQGLPSMPVVVILVGLALSTEVWLIPYTGHLKWAVRTYVVLIMLMGLMASAMPARDLAAMGALLFILSDLLLAIQLFRFEQRTVFNVPISITLSVTYTLAQIAITIGAGFSQPLLAMF